MKRETLFTIQSLYRDDLRVTGFRFGAGEKAACIVGALRGNEIQQMYVASQLVRVLGDLERAGCIVPDREILVVPSVNHYSMNIGKRFRAKPPSASPPSCSNRSAITGWASSLRHSTCPAISCPTSR